MSKGNMSKGNRDSFIQLCEPDVRQHAPAPPNQPQNGMQRRPSRICIAEIDSRFLKPIPAAIVKQGSGPPLNVIQAPEKEGWRQVTPEKSGIPATPDMSTPHQQCLVDWASFFRSPRLTPSPERYGTSVWIVYHDDSTYKGHFFSL